MLKGKKTTVWLLFIVVLLLIISVVPAVGLSNKTKKSPQKKLTTIEKIEAAEQKGKISKDREILYKAQSLFDPHSLPQEFRGTPSKEGTMVLLELLKNKRNIKDKKIRQKINSLTDVKKILPKKVYRRLYRGADYDASVTAAANSPEPVYLDNLTSSAYSDNFQVWYSTTDPTDAVNTADSDPANGTPDYVDDMLESLEESWAQEIDVMGYREPEGGSEKFQVFLKELGTNYYGLTYPVNITGTYKSDAFLIIENDFYGFTTGNAQDNQSVTAAHEFFHAIQFAYNNFDSDYEWDDEFSRWVPGPNAWWMEATATWMEDEVYSYIDDYLNYLYTTDEFDEPDGWFAWPEKSLTEFDGWREYGSVLFPKYLQQKSSLKRDVIKNIWLSLENYNFSSAGNSVIKKIGAPFSSSYSYNPATAFNNIYADFMAQNYIINPDTIIYPTQVRYSSTDAFDLDERKTAEWGTEEESPYIWERSSSDSNINGPLSKSVATGNSEAPQYLGTNYNVINAPATAKSFDFKFTSASTSTKWAVKLLLWRNPSDTYPDGRFEVKTLVAPGGTSGIFNTRYFGQNSTYGQAVLVASVVGSSNPDSYHGYSYSVRYDTAATIFAYPYKAKKGSKVKLYGQVTPKPNGRIQIERYYSTGWKPIKYIYPSSLTSAGRFTWYWTKYNKYYPTKTGKYKIRVRFTGSATYSDSVSGYRTITLY